MEVLCSPCLRCSKACFQLLVVVACPSSSCAGLGVSRFSVFCDIFIVYSLYVYLLYLYYACPSLICPVGLCFWTHDMTSDWLPSGFPPRLPGHCRLVLAGSHDSLFLWYPAIDIVWLGPVFLTLGSLSHLALCDSSRRSLSPGRCGLQSLSRTPSLTLLTLTHDLTYNTPPVVSAMASTPNGEFVLCVSLCSLFYFCLFIIMHIPPSVSMIEIVLFKCSGNRIIGNVILKLK